MNCACSACNQVRSKMADDENDDTARNRHRQRRGLLKMYYGVGEETGKPTTIDPCDINGAHFQPETYLDKTFKEKTLTELMDKEGDISKQIKALDSDMQTLVYENYNKFISATDTIRKMKHDFKKMEEEMTELEKNMSAITDFSEKISSTLQDKRQQITKLSGVHSLLTKLQFLFELPSRLKKCVEMKQYGLAVRYYTKARDVLHQYSHMPSFQGIHQDCDEIVKELITRLREQLRNPKSTPKQLAECVDLLLQLREPADELCDEFITQARERLDENIRVLEAQVELKKEESQPADHEASESDTLEESKHQRPMDFLEFIDCGCNGFLSTVCLVIASYKEQFVERQIGDHVTDPEELERVVSKKLSSFMQTLMGQYFKITEARIELETDTGNNVLLVRALDRFHRRLQAVHKLLPDIGSSRSGANIIARAAHNRVIFYTQSLRQQFAVCLTDTRQALAALPRQTGKDKSHALSDLLTQTSNAILDQIKTVLNYLKAFIGPDITFSVKPYFRGPYCADDVREGLVVDFLKHVLQTAKDFCNKASSPPPSLVLLLSRLCTDFHESTITYVLSLTDEQFPVDEELRRGCVRTPVTELVSEARSIAQDLLNHYVKIQGLVISQMIRKSVDTRDWINTIEPRNVRAVMKRIVEDVTAIDTQVGQLYEEGARKAHSSDSSKFTYSLSSQAKPSRSQFSYTPSTGFDSSLLSNIQKLFSEKIEIFSPVEFSKVSVLTGIVKIALKTLLECVRLRTFGKYGLQQIQVDTHYLQLYLWRFVSDENLVHVLLDEVVNSAVNRSVEAELMEPSIVEVICDRG